MFRCVAKDKDGIPRVWGEAKSPKLAETNCRWELQEYLKRRREMSLPEFTFSTGAA